MLRYGLAGLITISFLFNTHTIAQQYETINLSDAKKYGSKLTQIKNFPLTQIPEGATSAFIVVDDNVAFLAFKQDNNVYLKTPTIQLSDVEYICNGPSAEYENDTIIVECTWMRGTVMGQKFTVAKNKLRFVSNIMRDVNEEVYAKAKLAEKQNNPLAFCEAYMCAQFYSMEYPYRVKEALSWANKIAKSDYQKKDYKKAAELMKSMELNCMSSTEPDVADLFPEEFKMIWGDATLYYLKADLNNDCVRLAKWLTEKYPDYTPVYLQLGDAYYNLKDTTESRSTYNKYIEQMSQKGLKAKIPDRIKARTK